MSVKFVKVVHTGRVSYAAQGQVRTQLSTSKIGYSRQGVNEYVLHK